MNIIKNFNLKKTENGALVHKTTCNKLIDFLAFAGSMRDNNEKEIIDLFNKAFMEDSLKALRLLFYIRDIRGGQGERRFFRVVLKNMTTVKSQKEYIERNMHLIPQFGRWDDLYSFMNTSLQNKAFDILKQQFLLDLNSATPSLLGKWLPSENTSSKETRKKAYKTIKAFKMTPRKYRKSLKSLRTKINIIETLISEGRYSEIEYDKIPSKAGLIYRNAFAKHDHERYNAFMNRPKEEVKLNANLYPYEIIERILPDDIFYDKKNLSDLEKKTLDNYWNNLPNYIPEGIKNQIAVVDTSGSMEGTPMNVAISLGIYMAQHNQGYFKNKFISFSENPTIHSLTGDNIVDIANNLICTDWGCNTNIEKTFDLILNTYKQDRCSLENIPEIIYIISDMEFDAATDIYTKEYNTLFEKINSKFERLNLKMPKLVFWNVRAVNKNIPMLGNDVNFVSGFSPIIFETVMKNITGEQLVNEITNNTKYSCIV